MILVSDDPLRRGIAIAVVLGVHLLLVLLAIEIRNTRHRGSDAE